MNKLHPAPTEFTDEEIRRDHVLQYFYYAHLPEPLRAVSARFCSLARDMVDSLPRNPERTVALRKLLESKDAAVRTHIAQEM